MKLRYLTAGLAMAGGLSAAAAALSGALSKDPVPPALAMASAWTPEPVAPPMGGGADAFSGLVSRTDPAPVFGASVLPAVAMPDVPLPDVEPPRLAWSRAVAPGETLDALLAEAGLAARDRVEVSLALDAEYDLRRLRPGHEVTVELAPDGSPRRVALDVDAGVRIEAVFGEKLATRVLSPDPEILTLAGETRIESSIFAALDEAGLPARFAVDLAQMLGGTVDFRREVSGGETLRLLWREARVDGKAVGQPEIAFAALNLGDGLYEVVWPEGGDGRATIFRDGEVLRVFAQPVEGARLSSVFGRRKHPVYGNVRMHTGVDFAAARGTTVRATAPGRVSFIGWRGGYGRVVEITHGADTMTRYAHLSAVPEGLSEGQRVMAGDMIGRVGATGTATGPNLHYEVRVDGRPTDPLSDERLAEAAEREAQDDAALVRLSGARSLLEEHLASDVALETTERL
ncbi:MAG: M23 family metallopeptidase [Candidatus Wenzhouxiangella sp. M2_3B_020]